MAIRASSSGQIDRLIADLEGPSAMKRDAAIARLTLIGARAVERLAALAQSDRPAGARIAALRALEGIGDVRALAVALTALDDPDDTVVLGAIALARLFVRRANGAAAVDRLTALTLDASRSDAVRIAALRALRDLEEPTVAPLIASLTLDASAAVRGQAVAIPRLVPAPPAGPPLAALTHAADISLPDDPADLRGWISKGANTVALSTLLRIIERVRAQEADEGAERRAEWRTVRAHAHAVLARRGSRIALYDLRESIEHATAPLPVDMLAALSLVGDVSCLEPIASAYARSQDRWWRDHLADAFRTIAKRENVTKRHAAMRKIEKRFGIPGAAGRAG